MTQTSKELHMLRLPMGGDRDRPAGIFIGDQHDELFHVVQLTASITQLSRMGVRVLFLEAFYADDPVGRTTPDLRQYLNGRKFNHIGADRPTGQREHAVAYQALIQRCKRAGMAVLGVDRKRPASMAAATLANAMRYGRWRKTTVNYLWQGTIEKACREQGWPSFVLFGGRDHGGTLKGIFGARLNTTIWDRARRSYVPLP